MNSCRACWGSAAATAQSSPCRGRWQAPQAGANLWSPVDDNHHPQRGRTRPMLQPGRVLLSHVPRLSHKPSLQAGRFQSRPTALTLCKCQVNSCLFVATSSSAFSECCGIFFFFQTFSTLSRWGNPQVQRANSARNWSEEGIQCSKSQRKRLNSSAGSGQRVRKRSSGG